MDHARGLRGEGADGDRPRANLFFASREVALEAERLVGGAGERGERRLREPGAGEHLRPVGRIELGDLRFELGANGNDFGAGLRGCGPHGLHERAIAGEVALIDVGHVENRLGREQAEFLDGLPLGLVERERAQRLFLTQPREALFHRFDLELRLLVGALRRPLRLRQKIVEVLDVGEHEFDLDRLHVRHGVHRAGHVDHVGVLEAADDLENRVDLADVGEELVAETFALARPLHNPGDVDELERGGDHFLWRDVFRDPLEPVVGHAHHPFVGLDRAKRIVRALGGLRLREGVEKSALADVRQSDDACFHESGDAPRFRFE